MAGILLSVINGKSLEGKLCFFFSWKSYFLKFYGIVFPSYDIVSSDWNLSLLLFAFKPSEILLLVVFMKFMDLFFHLFPRNGEAH